MFFAKYTCHVDPFIFGLCFTISRRNKFERPEQKQNKTGCCILTWWTCVEVWKEHFSLCDSSQWYLLSHVLPNDCQILAWNCHSIMADNFAVEVIRNQEKNVKKKKKMKRRNLFSKYLECVWVIALCFCLAAVVARSFSDSWHSYATIWIYYYLLLFTVVVPEGVLFSNHV